MPVLIEAVNVIVRNETITEKYPGGLGSYWMESPNTSICSDDYLTRVGFVAVDAFREFIDRLVKLGFRFVEDGECIDIAVVDQMDGLVQPCRWLNVADHPDGFQYAALRGDLGAVIEKPVGWRFEGSIAERGRFSRSEILIVLDDETLKGQSRIDRFEVVSAKISPEFEPISAESIEEHRLRLIAVHGDTVRQVWRVELDGRSYPIGEVRIRDIPEFQVTDPESCYLIAALDASDRIGIILPATGGGIEGLSPSQRSTLAMLPQMGAIKGSGTGDGL